MGLLLERLRSAIFGGASGVAVALLVGALFLGFMTWIAMEIYHAGEQHERSETQRETARQVGEVKRADDQLRNPRRESADRLLDTPASGIAAHDSIARALDGGEENSREGGQGSILPPGAEQAPGGAVQPFGRADPLALSQYMRPGHPWWARASTWLSVAVVAFCFWWIWRRYKHARKFRYSDGAGRVNGSSAEHREPPQVAREQAGAYGAGHHGRSSFGIFSGAFAILQVGHGARGADPGAVNAGDRGVRNNRAGGGLSSIIGKAAVSLAHGLDRMVIAVGAALLALVLFSTVYGLPAAPQPQSVYVNQLSWPR